MTRTMNTTTAPLIFIVDDDVSVRRSTRRLVRSLGIRAEAFASAQDLLNSGPVADTACLILDVRMPEMDGPELQGRLRKTRQRIPMVFISARVTKEEKTGHCDPGYWLFCTSPSGRTRCCA